MQDITTERYEPWNPDGFLAHQNNPALFFLGARSQFYPDFQSRQLSHIRELATCMEQCLGMRHGPAALSYVQRGEIAILPDGIIYKMGAIWNDDVRDLPLMSRSKSCQVVDGWPQEDWMVICAVGATSTGGLVVQQQRHGQELDAMLYHLVWRH